MKCNKIRLTDICKKCVVGNEKADCPTYREDDSTQRYATPPNTIFNLVPYKNHEGEQIICVESSVNSDPQISAGEIFTVIEHKNGRIRLDKFKEYPHMWFGTDGFKRRKATYNGIEYTFALRS